MSRTTKFYAGECYKMDGLSGVFVCLENADLEPMDRVKMALLGGDGGKQHRMMVRLLTKVKMNAREKKPNPAPPMTPAEYANQLPDGNVPPVTHTQKKVKSAASASSEPSPSDVIHHYQLHSRFCKAFNDRYNGIWRFTWEQGRTYWKIYRRQADDLSAKTVFCFIGRYDGAIYKAASETAPAKGARFTILTENDLIQMMKVADASGKFLYNKRGPKKGSRRI